MYNYKSKRMTVGALNTQVRILKKIKTEGPYPSIIYVDVGNTSPDQKPIWRHVNWTGSFGSEVLQANSLGIKDVATITMRYLEGLDSTCVIVCKDDLRDKTLETCKKYEIISGIDNVQKRNTWVEFKVKAMQGS